MDALQSTLLSAQALEMLVSAGKFLGVLLLGWLAARLISLVVYRLLQKTTLDDKLVEKLGINLLMEEEDGDKDKVERFFAAVVYYILLALVVVGALQTAGLSQAAAPIENVVSALTGALPLIFKAGLILLVAYFGGRIVQILVTRLLGRSGVDSRFTELSTPKGEDASPVQPFSETAGQVLFWLAMFIGLAGALDALQISALADPLQNAIDQLFGLLPAIGVAAVLLLVGFVMGQIARAVIQNLLSAIGFDRWMEKVKLIGLFGETAPSRAAGTLALLFIMLQVSIAALNELGLETLSLTISHNLR